MKKSDVQNPKMRFLKIAIKKCENSDFSSQSVNYATHIGQYHWPQYYWSVLLEAEHWRLIMTAKNVFVTFNDRNSLRPFAPRAQVPAPLIPRWQPSTHGSPLLSSEWEHKFRIRREGVTFELRVDEVFSLTFQLQAFNKKSLRSFSNTFGGRWLKFEFGRVEIAKFSSLITMAGLLIFIGRSLFIRTGPYAFGWLSICSWYDFNMPSTFNMPSVCSHSDRCVSAARCPAEIS